jgi:threonine aldolase
LTTPIDLRSDTVTRPSPAMRRAMAEAEVGDDVYGEDPSVNRLQELAASLLGSEAALFVPSGTMANQAALRALTRPGDLVLAGDEAHILKYESGAPAALSGVHVRTIGGGGSFDGADVRAAVTPDESHFPPTTAVFLENTHNCSGGRVFPEAQLEDVAKTARDLGLALHLDGARLWNAVIATGVPAASWAEPFDTVSFCLSKGLGAPVGSLVCGAEEVIRRVHRARKLLGGGMRQAGILAAAGIFALEHNIERLAEDHANARRLAAGLERLGFRVDPAPETNMVMFDVADTMAFLRATRERDLLINPVAEGRFRAVTHLDVSERDIDEALAIIEDAARGASR